MSSEQHCEPEVASNVSRGFVDVIGFIMILTFIPSLIRTATYLRKNSHASTQKWQHILFWIGIVFQMVTIMTIINFIISSICYCQYTLYNKVATLFNTLRVTYIILFTLHYYLLLLIFFIRVYFAFKGSTFALKKCTVICYTVFYILQPVLFICGGFIFLMINQQIGSFIIGVTGIFLLLLIISIVMLYVQKLIAVYKLSGGDEHYMHIITKTTILTVICLIVTMIAYSPFFCFK